MLILEGVRDLARVCMRHRTKPHVINPRPAMLLVPSMSLPYATYHTLPCRTLLHITLFLPYPTPPYPTLPNLDRPFPSLPFPSHFSHTLLYPTLHCGRSVPYRMLKAWRRSAPSLATLRSNESALWGEGGWSAARRDGQSAEKKVSPEPFNHRMAEIFDEKYFVSPTLR